MSGGPTTKVFISYSHADRGLVTPVVQLLRSLPFPVFRDQDGIAPGEVWEERLIDELEQATHVLVFWCSHSASSEWVCCGEAWASRSSETVRAAHPRDAWPSGC